jgi:hypothetical protein
MDEFEKAIGATLHNRGKFNATKAETLRKETVQMFDKKLKIVKIITWAFLLVDALIMVGLAGSFAAAKSPKVLIILAVIFLVVYNSTILMKLWYWVLNAKYSMLKEIKQLQLQIAELAGREPPAED